MSITNLHDYEDRKAAAFLPDERRALDRSKRVYVCHHEGGYGVTDGMTTIPAHDLEDARRREFVHNMLGDLAVEAGSPASEIANCIHALRDHPTDPLAGA